MAQAGLLNGMGPMASRLVVEWLVGARWARTAAPVDLIPRRGHLFGTDVNEHTRHRQRFTREVGHIDNGVHAPGDSISRRLPTGGEALQGTCHGEPARTARRSVPVTPGARGMG
jgi:hypothetical protein